jgi:hypothetical protein
LTYLYIADAVGNIYYNGSISLVSGDYFTFTLVAYPTGYLQTSASDSGGNFINQVLQPSGGTILYATIGSSGVNPIQVGTLVVAVPASGVIEMTTSTISITAPTTIKGNQQTLLTNLFLAQTSNYFDFYSLNSNAEMYLDVAGNAYLAGVSTVQMKTAAQDILLDATSSNILITNSNGNINLSATGTVAVTAPSIDMCNNYIQHINYLSFNNNARISENVANLDIVGSGTGSIGITATSSITLTAGSNLNMLSPLLNFSNAANIGGQLKIDANAQLNYATMASGYDIGSNAPIPLIQCGTIALTISENNTLIGGDYAIPIPYDDTSYCLQLTYKTNSPYASDAGIVWSGEAYTNDTFQIQAIGSNVGAGVTLDWYWTTIGKYPKGAAV